MQNAAHDNFGTIVSGLSSLVENVQASISLVERAIAGNDYRRSREFEHHRT